MSMNDVVSAERVHIGFFGCRNAGKSSLVNAITAQELSVVSDTAGTTTDPVKKSMELLPIGPVVIVDTPGFDDLGELGEKRVARTRAVLRTIDVAVLVIDVEAGVQETDRELLALIEERKVPYLIAWNKSDEHAPAVELPGVPIERQLWVSAKTGNGIKELKDAIGALAKGQQESVPLVADLIHPGDLLVLVVPIDSAAPKGRLILPQQQTIRDILDADARALVVKENELKHTLEELRNPPAMVITDSQAFKKVAADVAEEVPLTSFSILMARHKGFLELAVSGAAKLDDLSNGDKVLICEGCTHHRQCGDIGTEKLPKWLREYTGKELSLEFTSGKGFPDDVSGYELILHCGGCMLTEREVLAHMEQAAAQGTPVTNYGTAIAQMNGILKRSLSIFPDLAAQVAGR
ncbi:MAG: [FeFe] hydrogenase H-cluster maturation GTPase HydF [Lachnospiraceae bacterium]|nr:[FeFe] hydrogenase H-cluster maturation GTPase HydF [Lachnospiraceae bacterium]